MSFAIAHAAEIDEVVISCSSGDYGQCYKIAVYECPLSMFDIYAVCEWTGCTNDECYSYDEFECWD